MAAGPSTALDDLEEAAGKSVYSEASEDSTNFESIELVLKKVCRVLNSSSMTSKQHIQAVKLLSRLQADIMRLPSSCAAQLSMLLISMSRKLIDMKERDDAEAVEDYEKTFTLVFILLTSLHARENGHIEAYDADGVAIQEEKLLSEQRYSLWQCLCRPISKKRSHEDEEEDDGFSDVHSVSSAGAVKKQKTGTGAYNFSSQKDVDELNSKMEREREDAEALVARPFLTDSTSSKWHDILYDTRGVAKAILDVTTARLHVVGEISTLTPLAAAYARSLLERSRSGLLGGKKHEFVSLKVNSLLMLGNSGVADAVSSLVASAASESAQVCYRDMLLSFLLPISFLGTRRTLLLPRAVSARATKDFSTYVSLAHESAICGLLEAFESSCELKRCCAILTTIAMLTTGSDIRSDVAFGGRVHLPFLETPEPKKGALQLYFDLANRQAIVFSVVNGKPQIELCGSGVNALETALVLLADEK